MTTFHNTEQPPETTLTSLPIVRTARAIYARRSMRYALQKSSVANGVSQGVADAAIETARLKHACCDVFHLGCIRPKAVAADRVAQYRKELRLPCGTRVLVHVGSFQGQKNHAAILKIFRKVVETMPNAMLLLIGDGPLRPAIQEQVGRLDLDRHVRLLGTRGDATALMQLGDLFLFPSYHEGLSIALMEASAVGLPIVASDIPGNREATGDGASARLHPVDDIEGMAASVIELLDNPSACRRMAGYGREIYERTFSIEASMKRLVTLYDGVLQTHTQSRAARLAA